MTNSIRIALLVGSFLLVNTSASGDPRDSPRNTDAAIHFETGGKLFGLRQFKEAITEYQAGAMIEAAPVFDLALGQCYRQLQEWDNALWHLRRFLRYGHPTGATLQGVNDLIVQIEHDREIHEHEKREKSILEASRPTSATSPGPTRITPPSTTTIIRPRTLGEPWYYDRIGLGLTGGGLAALGLSAYLLTTGLHLHDLSNDPSIATDGQRQRYQSQATLRYELAAGACGLGLGLVTGGLVKLTVYPAGATISGQF